MDRTTILPNLSPMTLTVVLTLLAIGPFGGALPSGLLVPAPIVAQENCAAGECDPSTLPSPQRPQATGLSGVAGSEDSGTQSEIETTDEPPCDAAEPKKCKVEGELEYDNGCLTGTVTCKGKGITITIEIDTCDDGGDEGGN